MDLDKKDIKLADYGYEQGGGMMNHVKHFTFIREGGGDFPRTSLS